METLSSHYARLLGLDDSWRVESVDLQIEDRLVEIRLSVSAHHRHPLAASVGPEGAHEKSRRKWPTGIQRGAWPASPT